MVGAQDHDLALRVFAEVGPHRIKHLPLVLYHWRQSEKSFSATDMESCRDAARRAVALHLRGQGEVKPDPALPQWHKVRFTLPSPAPRVSVITAAARTFDADMYDPALVACVAEAAQATGDILLFLSPHLHPEHTGWLRALVAQASRADIGAAGALLLAPGGARHHTGYILQPRLVAQSVTPPSDAADPGYRGQFALPRNVAAVSLDCLAVRRDAFVAAGGLTASAGDFADVDLCLRLAARGLRTVWTPQARLRYARPPREPGAGAAWMRQRWRDELAADPYHNPNLTLRRGRLSLA
jgi:hypothetical protein